MSYSIGQKFTPVTLLKFAFPSMVMMVFMSCYTIIDGIFISRFLGDSALSAVNIVFPVINILLAIGVMLATGGSAVTAKEMGEGNTKKARSHFSFLVVIGFCASLLLLVLTLFFLEPVCRLLGSDDVLLPYCTAYLATSILFAPACMLQSLFQSFFVTAGKPQIGLSLTIVGGISNAVLDYVFLGPLHLGIEGAALATGIGQMIPAVFGVIYFFWRTKHHAKGDLYFAKFRFDWPILAKAASNGSSEMVTNLSNAVVTYLFNRIMMSLVGPSGVAAITIILYAQFLFNALYMGFSMGVSPIISFNYGADNQRELKHVYKICICFVLLSSVLITALSYFASEWIVRIFVGVETDTYQLAVNGFSLFSLCFLFSGFNIFSSALFTAFSDGKTSAIISFIRTFGCILLALLVLPALLGLNGVWLAIPAAEFASLFLCIFFHVRKKAQFHFA